VTIKKGKILSSIKTINQKYNFLSIQEEVNDQSILSLKQARRVITSNRPEGTPPWLISPGRQKQTLARLPTRGDMDRALIEMKAHTAPGNDKIPADALKNFSENLINLLNKGSILKILEIIGQLHCFIN